MVTTSADASPPDLRPASRRRRPLTRRAAALGVVAGVLLSACGDDDGASSGSSGTAGSSGSSAAAEELTEIALQLSWLPDTEFAPLFLADANGHFAANGVDVEFISGGPDIGAVEAIVASGAADLGIATDIFSVVSANADGNDFVVLGALYPHGLHGFISPQDAPVASAEDLAGKRIGGSQGVQPKFDAIFELNGLDPKDYTFVPSGFGPELVINGDVDVQSVFVTDEVLAYKRATGEDPVLFTWDDAGLPSYTLVLFTTRDYLEDHRDALKGFLAAAQRGFDENVADPEAGPRLVADVYGVDAGLTFEDEVAKNAEYLKYVSSEGTEEHGWMWVDPERVGGPIYQGMRAAGLATPPVEDVIDSSLIEELKSAP